MRPPPQLPEPFLPLRPRLGLGGWRSSWVPLGAAGEAGGVAVGVVVAVVVAGRGRAGGVAAGGVVPLGAAGAAGGVAGCSWVPLGWLACCLLACCLLLLLGYSLLEGLAVGDAARLVAKHVERLSHDFEGLLRPVCPALVRVQSQRQLAVGAFHALATHVPCNVQYLYHQPIIIVSMFFLDFAQQCATVRQSAGSPAALCSSVA
jgi:hypothetical protein